MRKHSKKLTAVVAGTAAAVALSGVAYAYWTSAGSGTGSASTGTTSDNLTITSSSVTGMVPGDVTAVTATVHNPNSYSVNVNAVSATVSVTAPEDCNPAWFHVATQTPNARVLAGADLAVPTTITFDDNALNQDSCKSATVNLTWSSTSL